MNRFFWFIVSGILKSFRRGDEGQGVTENGAGEKVKEAIAKSLETSKATVEDAAKSAADIAGETMHKAKEKVKRSLSGDRERERQNELWFCCPCQHFVRDEEKCTMYEYVKQIRMCKLNKTI